MHSLSTRLLALVSLLLLLFFSVTILALDSVFRNTQELALRNLLETHLLALLAAAEPTDEHSLELPEELPESRYSNPGSGLFGQLRDASGETLWRSASSVGIAIGVGAPQQALAPGERLFTAQTLADGTDVRALSLKVSWEFTDDQSREFVFSVAEDTASQRAQMARFRQQLLGWFGVLTLALLLSLAGLLRWVLAPLRRAEREVSEIEAGERQALGEGYPTELRGLTSNMNALVASERDRLQRYRETLDNLAHSLKTPLAVARSLLEESRLPPPQRRRLEEQIERMDGLIGHQLRRASAAGATGLGLAPVGVQAVIERMLGALDKVYAEKRPQVERALHPGAVFYGDEGDLTELVGNLLDNAYKFCRRRIRVEAVPLGGAASRRSGLRLSVEDDGEGIDAGDRERALQRGTRLDERVEGHGIGLAVAGEIVAVHGGRIDIEASPLGGARFVVDLPAR